MLRATVVLFFLVSVLTAREFDPRHDAFAFSNDTVLNYEVTADGKLRMSAKAKSGRPTHACFLFTRSAMQFWKFACFEPRQPRLSKADYRAKVRALFRIPPWVERRERIVFPGYADLWSFSRQHENVIRDELGSWVLTYVRVGNWRMISPIISLRQRTYAEKLFAAVSRGEVRAMYLAKFPHMNHVVLVYRAERLPDGRMRFQAYDANYAGKPARLDYVSARNIFEFERRFYWPGGELHAFPVYDMPLH
jgi:hypothetical protein